MNTLEEKIVAYCGDLEIRIRSCKRRCIANMLKEQLHYELLQGHAEAELFTRCDKILEKLIENTFDCNGKNKFLEAP